MGFLFTAAGESNDNFFSAKPFSVFFVVFFLRKTRESFSTVYRNECVIVVFISPLCYDSVKCYILYIYRVIYFADIIARTLE